ncbi:MAG: hypothetical protein WBC70_04910 [Candidatus Aminicenantales bacterium]
MPGAKSWEVWLYSDFTDYRVWCKNFRSFRRAVRFMKRELGSENSFYCATISNDAHNNNRPAFQTYYWNGRAVIPHNEPWVLSRRQASKLEPNGNGHPAGPD